MEFEKEERLEFDQVFPILLELDVEFVESLLLFLKVWKTIEVT